MSKKCEVCGKGPMSGNTVSHSHHKEKRRFTPNLHRVQIEDKGEIKILRVCAKCLKKIKAKA